MYFANGAKSMKNKVIKVILAIVLITFVVTLVLNKKHEKPVYEAVEATQGYTSTVAEFDDITFEMVDSTTNFDGYTFHLIAKNISDKPVNVTSVFAVKNGDKRFDSSNTSYSDRELNPGMKGTVDVTVKMNSEDFITGESLIFVHRGVIAAEQREMIINK